MNRDAFLIDTDLGKIPIASIPKCGQHTLKEYSIGMIPLSECINYRVRVAFIRDPVDRLLSCYHFFHSRSYDLDMSKIGRWEDFIDWALHSNDEHVLPQSEFINNTFNKFAPMASMSALLNFFTGKKIIIGNASKRHTTVDETYRDNDIKKRYNADYELLRIARG